MNLGSTKRGSVALVLSRLSLFIALGGAGMAATGGNFKFPDGSVQSSAAPNAAFTLAAG